MPFDPIRDVQSTVDMVEQLRRAHGAVSAASSQPSQLPDFIHETVNEATQSEARVEDRLTRRNDSPNSSGSEEGGQKKRSHIGRVEKKALALLAANICQAELRPRGKDEFWRILIRKRVEEGGPEHN